MVPDPEDMTMVSPWAPGGKGFHQSRTKSPQSSVASAQREVKQMNGGARALGVKRRPVCIYFAVVPPDNEQGYATVTFKTHHAIIDTEFENRLKVNWIRSSESTPKIDRLGIFTP